MGYSDLLNSTCTVERLSGFTDYDFSASDEGEVVESWQVVASSVACRVDRTRTPTIRRSDGMVQTGSPMMFTEKDADIRDGDRILCNGIIYTVNDSYLVEGMKDPHHREIIMSIIDWVS